MERNTQSIWTIQGITTDQVQIYKYFVKECGYQGLHSWDKKYKSWKNLYENPYYFISSNRCMHPKIDQQRLMPNLYQYLNHFFQVLSNCLLKKQVELMQAVNEGPNAHEFSQKLFFNKVPRSQLVREKGNGRVLLGQKIEVELVVLVGAAGQREPQRQLSKPDLSLSLPSIAQKLFHLSPKEWDRGGLVVYGSEQDPHSHGSEDKVSELGR